MKIEQPKEETWKESFFLENLFCKIEKTRDKLIIHEDESYISKIYSRPLIIFSMLSLSCFSVSLFLSLFWDAVIPLLVFSFIIVCNVISFELYLKYKYYKGRVLDIIIDGLNQEILFNKVLPEFTFFGKVRFDDVKLIIILTEYINSGKFYLVLQMKNDQGVKIFNGTKEECVALAQNLIEMIDLPIFFKEPEYLIKPLVISLIVFGLFWTISFILNDIIGQIFFCIGFVLSVLIYFDILRKLNNNFY